MRKRMSQLLNFTELVKLYNVYYSIFTSAKVELLILARFHFSICFWSSVLLVLDFGFILLVRVIFVSYFKHLKVNELFYIA